MIEIILMVVASSLLGTALGVMTGLIPGLHVNNVAIILLSLSPAAVLFLRSNGSIEESTVLLLVASAIVSTSMAHTFLDFIPSTFLGAPEGDTALSVLPAHSMLLEGHGYKAVYLSAVGSFGAVMVGFLLLIPYKMIVNEPVNGYSLLKEYMVWVLIGICVLMLTTESSELPYIPRRLDGRTLLEKGRFSRTAGVLAAFGLFLISGLMGLAVLDLPVSSPFGLPSTVLFPTLSGLFGTSTLLESVRGGASVPEQKIEAPDIEGREAAASIVSGGFAGSVVGFLPGMSGGVATVVAMLFRKDPKPSSVILTLSAINTANSFFVLSALFLILRPRSGAAIVVDDLLEVVKWSDPVPPSTLALLLLAAVLASTLGFFLTILLGGKMANIMPRIPYGKLAWGIIAFIVVMVFMFTGPLGLLVLSVSTAIGMIAPQIGIRRSHAMGVLLLPVIVMIW